MLTTVNSRREATQKVMAVKLTMLNHKIAIQLQLEAESCTICSSRSRRPVRELLDTPSYKASYLVWNGRPWPIWRPGETEGKHDTLRLNNQYRFSPRFCQIWSWRVPRCTTIFGTVSVNRHEKHETGKAEETDIGF